jgi:hypothetical protein
MYEIRKKIKENHKIIEEIIKEFKETLKKKAQQCVESFRKTNKFEKALMETDPQDSCTCQ